jgi:hypothetical protein
LRNTQGLKLDRSAAILAAVLWVTSVLAVFTDAVNGQKSTPKFHDWGYYYSSKSYDIGLYPDAIQRYAGKSLVVVARKKDDLLPKDKDTRIVFSNVYPITKEASEYRTSVNLSDMPLRIGDRIEADAYIVPKTFDTKSVTTIEDLKKHDVEFFEFSWADVWVDKLTEETLKRIVGELSRPQKAILQNDLNTENSKGAEHLTSTE